MRLCTHAHAHTHTLSLTHTHTHKSLSHTDTKDMCEDFRKDIVKFGTFIKFFSCLVDLFFANDC